MLDTVRTECLGTHRLDVGFAIHIPNIINSWPTTPYTGNHMTAAIENALAWCGAKEDVSSWSIGMRDFSRTQRTRDAVSTRAGSCPGIVQHFQCTPTYKDLVRVRQWNL
jgi:hypothetical protein